MLDLADSESPVLARPLKQQHATCYHVSPGADAGQLPMIHDTKEPPDYTTHGRQLFEHGRQEFLDGRYFEAHDIWEELWQRLLGSDRRYLQGLIHLTVGAYHFENGNARGARSQWKKAALKIGEYPSCHWGIDVSAWIRWIELYLGGNSPGPFPNGLPFQSERFPSYLPMSPE